MELLQDPGEGLPVLLERPLVLGAGGVVVVGHLGKLLLRDAWHSMTLVISPMVASPPAGAPHHSLRNESEYRTLNFLLNFKLRMCWLHLDQRELKAECSNAPCMHALKIESSIALCNCVTYG